ncbi:MAG: ACP phosphodiesterase [Bacteroidales bacterium]|nr:ACP phosphodiesterase [Bacteroidales bacterium]
MNFLAHIYLSGENDDIKFGNFIGDWIKGKKYQNYPENIKKGILLHREIDSYTDSHPIVHNSIVRLRPAYGKHSGVAVDILYDHFLAFNWELYSEISLEDYVKKFHSYVLKNSDLLPKKARRFAFPFIRKKRLICYADLVCFEDVLNKMAIYTSMPNKAKQAMQIIKENYKDFKNEFQLFFSDIQTFVKGVNISS